MSIKRAFAVGAHPDDIEFLMAGTLMLLGRQGYELHYMTLADGCCGTTQHDRSTIAGIRAAEAQAAAAQIGAVYHGPLVGDLEIFYEPNTLARLASVMREVAPEILLVHSPQDYMEDHTCACRLAVTAAFARGMPNFPVDPHREPVAQPVTLYHAQPYGNRTPLGEPVRPGLFVDVTSLTEAKAAMLACHASQKQWLDESQGHDSYIQAMHDLDRQVGAMSGRFEYAEGWRRHLHLGFCGPEDDPLRDALGEHVLVDES
ncbi:MAG: PIG-L family deacetylase [Pirellulales bacterium]